MRCPKCGAPVDVYEYVCFGGEGNTYMCLGNWMCGWRGKFDELKLNDEDEHTEPALRPFPNETEPGLR